jgi:hypothetical protein
MDDGEPSHRESEASNDDDPPTSASQIAAFARDTIPFDERELLAAALWAAAVECGDEDVRAVSVATLDSSVGALVITEASLVFAPVRDTISLAIPRSQIAQAYEVTAPRGPRVLNRLAASAGLRLRLVSGEYVTLDDVGSPDWASELAAHATAAAPSGAGFGPRIAEDGTALCPWCAEPVQPEAVLCRWCDRDIETGRHQRDTSPAVGSGRSSTNYLRLFASPGRLVLWIVLLATIVVGYTHVTAADFKAKCAVHQLSQTFGAKDPVSFPDNVLCDIFYR